MHHIITNESVFLTRNQRHFSMARFILLSIWLAIIGMVATSQPKTYTTQNAHAHNDYEHDSAFTQAFNSGFGSIEADVYLVNDQLMLAHHRTGIKDGYTLQAIYLHPLQQQLKLNAKRTVRLLVDIKDNYPAVLAILQKQLQPLRQLLSTPTNQGQLTIIISGNKPPPQDFDKYPDYIFFDNHFDVAVSASKLSRVAMISLSFSKYFLWNGKSTPDTLKVKRVQQLVDSAHLLGKPIRFWAAADTPMSWQLQKNLAIDYIGTDQIEKLAAWLKTVQ